MMRTPEIAHKHLLPILFLFFLSCDVDTGGEKDHPVNSDVSRQVLSRFLELVPQDSVISEVRYYFNNRGIDPYYMFRFRIEERHLRRIVSRHRMEVGRKSIPSKSAPEWFEIPDSRNLLQYWKEELGSHSEILIFERRNGEAFYYYATM